MRNFVYVLFLALSLVACGDDAPDPMGGDSGGTPPGCAEPAAPEMPVIQPGDGHAGIDTTPGSCGADWVVGVTGRVTDPAGNGLPGARTQLCVTTPTNYLCLSPPTTNETGAFDIGIEDLSARCVVWSVMRTTLYTDRYASSYCDLDPMPVDGVHVMPDPIIMHPVEPPPCLPASAPEAEARTVAFADGLALVDLIPDNIANPSYYFELAAARVDLTGSCMLDHAPDGGLDATWGLRPDVNVSDGVAMRFPNVTGLAAGARVDLYVMGGLSTNLAGDTPVEEGHWANYGTGTVNAEGTFIDSDEGSRLPTLNWVGYRAQ